MLTLLKKTDRKDLERYQSPFWHLADAPWREVKYISHRNKRYDRSPTASPIHLSHEFFYQSISLTSLNLSRVYLSRGNIIYPLSLYLEMISIYLT